MIAGTLILNRWTFAFTTRTLGVTLGGGMLFVFSLLPAARACDEAPPDLARERLSLKAVCAKCHNLQIVMDTPMSYDAWHDTVQKMVDQGAKGTDNGRTRVYSRTTGLLVPTDPNLESEVRQTAEQQIAQAALDDGILEKARQNARNSVTALLYGLGFRTVDVE